MTRPRWILGLLVGVLATLPGMVAQAQEREACLRPLGNGAAAPGALLESSPGTANEFYVSSEGALCALLQPPDPTLQSAAEQVPSPGRAFLYSTLLPGLGQRQLGLDRWAAYLAGEVWAWIQFKERRREGRALQTRYRDLAWLVARRVSSGPRVDGSFEYYEALTKFNSSGAYDADPQTPGVQPEGNPETFNGSMWVLSQNIFFPDDPEVSVEVGSDQYEEALRYYLSRAYTPDLAWNWSQNKLQQAEFSGLIRSSDENLRRSTTWIGIILANHLLSAVDALVSARLGEASRTESLLSVGLGPGPYSRDSVLLTFSLPFD